MSWKITCKTCQSETKASNIVDFFDNYVDPSNHQLLCGECGEPGYMYKESKRQEGGVWERYIHRAARLPHSETYTPYIFLYSKSATDAPSRVVVKYYKDLRDEHDGRLKHGHGPGGPPVLHPDTLRQLLGIVLQEGMISKEDLQYIIDNH